MPVLRLSNDQRVGFIGMTGSGKTWLAEKLLKQQPRVIVIDNKGRVDWKGYYLTTNPRAALVEDKVIYRPGEDAIPAWFWELAMDTLHERGGGIIYIDEAAELTKPSSAPKGLNSVFRLGRELGVSVWWSTQESTAVFNTLIRQSERLIMFYNQGASDREKLLATAGDMAEVTAYLDPQNHEFIVYQNDKRQDPMAIGVYKAMQ